MFYDMQAVMELLGTLNTVRPALIYANRYFYRLFAHKKYFRARVAWGDILTVARKLSGGY